MDKKKKRFSETVDSQMISNMKDMLCTSYKIKRTNTEITQVLDDMVAQATDHLSLRSKYFGACIRKIVVLDIQNKIKEKYRKRLQKQGETIDGIMGKRRMFRYLSQAAELFINEYYLEMIFLLRVTFEIGLREKILELLENNKVFATEAEYIKRYKKLGELRSEKLFSEYKAVEKKYGNTKILGDLKKKIDKYMQDKKGDILSEFIHGKLVSIADYIDNPQNKDLCTTSYLCALSSFLNKVAIIQQLL